MHWRPPLPGKRRSTPPGAVAPSLAAAAVRCCRRAAVTVTVTLARIRGRRAAHLSVRRRPRLPLLRARRRAKDWFRNGNDFRHHCWAGHLSGTTLREGTLRRRARLPNTREGIVHRHRRSEERIKSEALLQARHRRRLERGAAHAAKPRASAVRLLPSADEALLHHAPCTTATAHHHRHRHRGAHRLDRAVARALAHLAPLLLWRILGVHAHTALPCQTVVP